jgi:BirA family biotin operon repressor/biotin-[acetyl-CoA-carboxylase] ligase
MNQLGGLSLAMGCAIANTVRILINASPKPVSISALGLKWPNDVLWDYQKLSGILIEFPPSPNAIFSQHTQAVIGVGLNVHQPSTESITQPWTDLSTVLGYTPDKNQVLNILVHQLADVLTQFQTQGFASFIQQWNAWDLTFGKRVNIITPLITFNGIGHGINSEGLFLLKTDSGEIKTFSSAEVSLRLADGI